MDKAVDKVDDATKKTAAPVDPHLAAQKRAADCGAEIGQVLTKHRCRIVPFIVQPLDPVGTDGSKALISTSYGIVPLDV